VLKALTRVFGSRNERLVKGFGRAVRQSSGYEEPYAALSEGQLKAKTDEFRNRGR